MPSNKVGLPSPTSSDSGMVMSGVFGSSSSKVTLACAEATRFPCRSVNCELPYMSFNDKVSNSFSLRQSLLAKRTSMICSVMSGPKVKVPTGIAPSSKRSGVREVEPSSMYLRTTVPSKPPPRLTLKYATLPSPWASPSYNDTEDDAATVLDAAEETMPTLKVEGTMGPTMA